MSTNLWLPALLVVPLVGALVVMLLPKANEKGAKVLGLVVSLVVLVMTVAMALQFHPAEAADFQFAVSYDWIPAFGVHFALGVDGIALVLIALSACLVPIVLIAGCTTPTAPGARSRATSR